MTHYMGVTDASLALRRDIHLTALPVLPTEEYAGGSCTGCVMEAGAPQDPLRGDKGPKGTSGGPWENSAICSGWVLT